MLSWLSGALKKRKPKMSYSKITKIKMSTYDIKWSKMARELTPYCWVCETTQNLAAHHFIRRAIKSTRLDIMNAVILCPSHHVFNHEFSAHKTPEKFKEWYKKEYRGHYDYLMERQKVHMTERQAKIDFKEKYET